MAAPVSTMTGMIARGRGGRSSFSGVTASVFGCTGFLGRYVVNQLGRVGSTVVAPFRGDELTARHLKPMGDVGQIVPTAMEMRDEDSVRRALVNSSVVVNLMGKIVPTIHYKLNDVHVQAAKRLAEIAKEENVPHFVHVSTNVPVKQTNSEWLSTKLEGEAAVKEIYPDACIVRPTDMFGAEDRFLNRMAQNLLHSSIIPLADDGDYRTQPVFVNDVATFVAAAARDPDSFAGKTLELGGPEIMTMRECYEFIEESTRREGALVAAPAGIYKLAAQLGGIRLPIVNPSPSYSGEVAKVELAENVLDTTKDDVLRFEDFDHQPVAVRSNMGHEILRRYRKGGDRSTLFYVD